MNEFTRLGRADDENDPHRRDNLTKMKMVLPVGKQRAWELIATPRVLPVGQGITACRRKPVKAAACNVRDDQITGPVEGKAQWASANPAIMVSRKPSDNGARKVAWSGDCCCSSGCVLRLESRKAREAP